MPVLRGQAILQSQNTLREYTKLWLILAQLLQISSTFGKNWAQEEADSEVFALWLEIWLHASGFSRPRSLQWEVVRTFLLCSFWSSYYHKHPSFLVLRTISGLIPPGYFTSLATCLSPNSWAQIQLLSGYFFQDHSLRETGSALSLTSI